MLAALLPPGVFAAALPADRSARHPLVTTALKASSAWRLDRLDLCLCLCLDLDGGGAGRSEPAARRAGAAARRSPSLGRGRRPPAGRSTCAG